VVIIAKIEKVSCITMRPNCNCTNIHLLNFMKNGKAKRYY
jgi:hypothetical protein